MFRRKTETTAKPAALAPTERVTSVLGPGTVWKGSLSGSGGVRIEGAFEGEIALKGMLVVGATGRVTCPHVRANVVIIAGAMRGDITAEKVEIRSSGRVWGNVTTAAFSTEEGAFLRGQIRMEEKVDIGIVALTPGAAPASEPAAQAAAPEAQAETLPLAEAMEAPSAAVRAAVEPGAQAVVQATAGETTNSALEVDLNAAPLAAPLMDAEEATPSENPIQTETVSTGRKRKAAKSGK